MSKLPSPVLEMLKKEAGYDITTSYGSAMLQKDIETKTGQRLGLNTVKRLVGLIDYNSEPRQDTLLIIAGFLGFKTWESLISYINDNISGFDLNNPIVDLELLPPGKKVGIEWDPDRKIQLLHIKYGEYEVLESFNSKLRKGDLLYMSQISEGFPLVVKKVMRDGINIGNYKAGLDTGIKTIEII